MKIGNIFIILLIISSLFLISCTNLNINNIKKEEKINNVELLYKYYNNEPIKIYLIPDKYWVEYWINRFGKIYSEEQLKIFETTAGAFLRQMTMDGWIETQIYVRWEVCDNKFLEEIIYHETGHNLNKIFGEVEKYNKPKEIKCNINK